jgi:starch synthase (maltosyl-transferring)
MGMRAYEKIQKMIIYNLFPLIAGRFSEWGSHFERAADMGFNWIFVNPIQYPGISGSLYSIKDYFSFNPLFLDEDGKPGEDQVREMIETAGRYGLSVMVDLVINHCAVDSDLIKDHPEWFQWERKGKIAHPFAMEDGRKIVWGDLAAFDHRNTKDPEGQFRFFLDVIEFLAGLGFRGFRCDAAYQVPRRLWERLIKETKKRHPGIVFVAETLGCSPDQTRKTAGAGFDYIFNSSRWWDFRSPWLMEQYHLTRDVAPSISFPESHDTGRLCRELDGNLDGMKQRYLFTALFSTGVMMPAGFEFGFRNRLHVVRTRPGDWEDTGVDLRDFIKSVNELKASHPVFMEESPTEILHCDNPQVLVMWKASTSTNEEALLILNRDIHHPQNFSVNSICDLMQSGGPCRDISPENRLDYLPEPFSYDLRPGQGMVLLSLRDETPDNG